MLQQNHLLVNREKYGEIGFKKWRIPKFAPTRPPKEISLIEMIDLVIEAGYQVKKRDAG